MNILNKKNFLILTSTVIVVSVCLYVNYKSVFISPRNSCEYLTRVESLRDLLVQINKSFDTNCLQMRTTEELEKIWGIEIYEYDSYETYTNSRLTSGWETESSKKDFDKPYKTPNDAYVVTRVNYEDKYYDLFITATKDFRVKHKGLNQWILEKYEDKDWCNQWMDTHGDVPYVKPDLLPGFVEPMHLYFRCVRPRNQLGDSMSFATGIPNNYVINIEVRIIQKKQ